jgi:hypothetical protein
VAEAMAAATGNWSSRFSIGEMERLAAGAPAVFVFGLGHMGRFAILGVRDVKCKRRRFCWHRGLSLGIPCRKVRRMNPSANDLKLSVFGWRSVERQR